MGRSSGSSASTAAGRRRSAGSGTRRSHAPPRKPARSHPSRKAAKSSRPKRARARRPAKAAPRRARSLRSFTPGTWRGRVAVLVLVLALAAGGYWFWFRDSSFVAINDIEVVGATSGEGEAIVAELTSAAEEMSTLNVDRERLEAVATSFATIKGVDIDPNFPHGLRLELDERPPAILAKDGEREVPVAADGTILTGVPVPEDHGLPVLDLGGSPAAGKLAGDPLEKALVAGAAPAPLRSLVEEVGESKDYGIVVTLRGGIPVRFGLPEGLAAKWRSAAAVLADPKLDYASYVDVRVPARPAAGGAARPIDEL